jgi:hypothetical protein
VRWEESNDIFCDLTVDLETDLLDPFSIRLSVREETEAPGKFNRVGIVDLNVAEFAGRKSSSRAFSLSNSRINARLKVTLSLLQLSGDPFFKVYGYFLVVCGGLCCIDCWPVQTGTEW